MAGFTKDEEILAAFGSASFLQMWTWPNLFRDQGKTSESSDGKEICDLTVIFGNTIILFSDKRIEFNNSKALKVAWCRWARKAISGSLKQLEGAERWLRENPDRVFVDKACTKPIPISLSNPESMTFILVVVTHGIERQLSSINDEGSLSFNNQILGNENWEQSSAKPFCLGNVSENRFVHVFTDETIRLVLSEFDTAKDFIAYLKQRETLFTLKKPVEVSKESDMVYLFYENYSDSERSRAILSAPELSPSVVSIAKEPISNLYGNPNFQAKKKADHAAYFWDHLIESFAFHALNGTTQFRNWNHTSEIEPALRLMASPGRFDRRVLAQAFMEFYYKVPPGQRGTRVVYSPSDMSVGYLFLLVPFINKQRSNDEYRELRNRMLQGYAYIFAGAHNELSSLVGIGAKTRNNDTPLSEAFFDEGQDYIFLDCADWSPEEQRKSEEVRAKYEENGLLATRTKSHGVVHEFPQ